MAPSDNGKFVKDVEHGHTAESVESPFIPTFDESADEAGDDHDFVYAYDPEDGGPWHACCEEEVEK
jgi:hypothetical protein